MVNILIGILGFIALVAVLYLIAVVGTGGLPKHHKDDEK
jgi:hypothetical protein